MRVFSLAENTKNVDAFSCWRNDEPYVFLNTFKSTERSRFDSAHELGHLVLHRHGGAKQGRSAEYEAHLFAVWKEGVTKAHIAAELAIPADEMENLLFGLTGDVKPPDRSTGRPSLRVI